MFARLHLLLVIVRRAHHGHVVAEFGGVFGETQGLDRGFDAGSRDQNFVRRSGLARDFQHIAALLIGKQNGFAGRAEHDDARNGVRE